MDTTKSTTEAPTRPRNFKPLFGWRSAICDSDLTPTQRHVALTLSLHMNERGGSCYPGQQTLANETGLTVRTVGAALKAIRDAGWITILEDTREDRPPGRPRISYEATVPEPPSDTDSDDKPSFRNLTTELSETDASPITNRIEGDIEDDIPLATAAVARKQTAKVLTPQQQLMEALVKACEWNRDEITPKKWKSIAVAAADLMQLPEPPDPDEVIRRGKVYQWNHPTWARTPSALVSHWADSAEVRKKPTDREVQRAIRREEWRNA